MSERDLSRMGVTDSKNVGPPIPINHLSNSKSVPALHHHTGSGTICKSNLTHLSFFNYKIKILTIWKIFGITIIPYIDIINHSYKILKFACI